MGVGVAVLVAGVAVLVAVVVVAVGVVIALPNISYLLLSIFLVLPLSHQKSRDLDNRVLSEAEATKVRRGRMFMVMSSWIISLHAYLGMSNSRLSEHKYTRTYVHK